MRAFDIGQQKEVMKANATDSIFCGKLVRDRILLTGCGDGNIIAFDFAKGLECLWGFGVDAVGAVHCMHVAPDLKSVVTGGDSGIPLKTILSGF